MPAKKVSALGWENCAQLSNARAELLVTLDAGPRIISYKLAGGESILRSYPDQAAKRREKDAGVSGGHRIWVAPETERTYAKENIPLIVEFMEPNAVRVGNAAVAPWQIRKEMVVSLAAENADVMIEHRLTNEGEKPERIASWGLTIMEPGGVEIIPQPPLGKHGPGEFLPTRAMILWSYTDLSDDRWRIGSRFITLTPKNGRPATKLGLPHRERWVGYVRGDSLFIKTFAYEDGESYPDMGSNYETFSKDDFIELESLSPLKELAPGQSVSHVETWHLFGNVKAPGVEDETALSQWLSPYLSKIGLL